MNIEKMLDQFETLGQKKTERIVWESALYYYGALLLNFFSIRKDEDAFNNIAIKFYGIVLGDSGSGKSFIVKSMEKAFPLDGYENLYRLGLSENFAKVDPSSEETLDDVKRHLPTNIRTNMEGTQEGLFLTVYAQNMSRFGSINLFTDEFGDTITGSAEMINKLKQMYDSELAPKIIKGNELTMNYATIEGIVCNFLAMGSSQGFSSMGDKELRKSVESGLYRRAFIVDVGSMNKIMSNRQKNNIEEVKEHLTKLWKKQASASRDRKKAKGITHLKIPPEITFPYSEGFIEATDILSDKMIDRSNEDTTDRFKKYDTGSIEMIIDMAHIMAFLEDSNEVTSAYLDKAYEYFIRTRITSENTFKPKMPHKIMYSLLSKKNGLTITEMSDLDHMIPLKATAIQDAVSGLKELCYMHNKHLNILIGAVVRYSIEELPINKLDKIILSVSQDNKYDHCINYKPTLLEWTDIPRLVTSENFDSFTCCHYEPSAQAKDGHRRQDSFVEEQNLIAFDIDSGMSIEEVKEILSPYTYLIYTTKSHQIDKNDVGIICDRFRIVMPSKVKFYVTPDQHKKMYENLEIMLGITANDVQTRNVSRMFYTNPTATIFENTGDLIDVSACIPDTISSNHIIPNLQNLSEMEATGEMSRREVGMMKWVLTQSSEGNRNNMLHNYMTFLMDLGSSDIRGKVFSLNAMTNSPLDESEVEIMLKAKRQ